MDKEGRPKLNSLAVVLMTTHMLEVVSEIWAWLEKGA